MGEKEEEKEGQEEEEDIESLEEKEPHRSMTDVLKELENEPAEEEGSGAGSGLD